MIHSIQTIQIIHTVRTVHTHSLFSRSDPKKGRTGSSKNVRPLTAPLSQYAAHYPLLMTLYSVLTPFSVMRLAGAENSDMMIS
ncbi:hypothetical protein DSO12_20205 [Salmonella enterica]|nr:hypothetical protein [Salmonella enterica]